MQMQSEWYKHFFHGVALDVWRNVVTPEQTRAEADFLEKVLECSPGARLLDVPCGNGRHSLELASRGYRTTGVDIAEEFVREAQSRAASGLQAEFLLGDMRQLPWEAEFDGAFCFGNSFGYTEHPGTVDFLTTLSRTLKRGSRFVLETGLVAESILPKLQERGWVEIDNILFLSTRKYEPAESRLHIQYTFVRDGKQETREAWQQVYTVAEVQRLLRQAGLTTLALYSSLDQQPYQLGSPALGRRESRRGIGFFPQGRFYLQTFELTAPGASRSVESPADPAQARLCVILGRGFDATSLNSEQQD